MEKTIITIQPNGEVSITFDERPGNYKVNYTIQVVEGRLRHIEVDDVGLGWLLQKRFHERFGSLIVSFKPE